METCAGWGGWAVRMTGSSGLGFVAVAGVSGGFALREIGGSGGCSREQKCNVYVGLMTGWVFV